MSSTSAPFGLEPIRHPSGLVRAKAYPQGISSGYATAIYFQNPVKLDTSGYLAVVTGVESLLGSFAGVEWTDSDGRVRLSMSWPANTSSDAIIAYVHDDPNIRYRIQANGPIYQSGQGDQADFVNWQSGNALGFGSAGISSSLAGAGSSGQLRILGLSLEADNAWGDAYTIVEVDIARHQYVADKAAI